MGCGSSSVPAVDGPVEPTEDNNEGSMEENAPAASPPLEDDSEADEIAGGARKGQAQSGRTKAGHKDENEEKGRRKPEKKKRNMKGTERVKNKGGASRSERNVKSSKENVENEKPWGQQVSSKDNEALRKSLLEDTAEIDKNVLIEKKMRENAAITAAQSFDPDKFKRANASSQQNVGANAVIEASKADRGGRADRGGAKSSPKAVKVGDWSPEASRRDLYGQNTLDDFDNYEASIKRVDSDPGVIPQAFEGPDGEDPLLDSMDEEMMNAILMEHGDDGEAETMEF